MLAMSGLLLVVIRNAETVQRGTEQPQLLDGLLALCRVAALQVGEPSIVGTPFGPDRTPVWTVGSSGAAATVGPKSAPHVRGLIPGRHRTEAGAGPPSLVKSAPPGATPWVIQGQLTEAGH